MKNFPYAVQESLVLAMWQAVPVHPGFYKPFLISETGEGDFTQLMHRPPVQVLNRLPLGWPVHIFAGNRPEDKSGANLPPYFNR